MTQPPERPPDGLVMKMHSSYKPVRMEDVVKPALTLARGIQACQSVGAEVFVSSGTALGFYRDGDFIDDDTDLDVGILADYETSNHLGRLERLLPQLLGFRLLRTLHYRGRPMQLAFVDNDNSCIFDIYFYYLNYEHDTVVNINTYGFMRYPRKMFEPTLKRTKNKHGTWPTLRNIKDYVEYQYGKDWKEPTAGDKGLYYRGTPH